MGSKKQSETPEREIEGNVVKLPFDINSSKPKNKPENPHAGHRARLRNRFVKNGLEQFEDHNALELFLFYAIPNRDVNGLSHDLINEFGSLHGVFDASFEDLCKVKGISEYSASLIKLLPAMAKRYEQEKVLENNDVYDTDDKIAEYMSAVYVGAVTEELYLLCLDSACRLLKQIKLGVGEIDKVTVSYRSIAEEVLKTKASNVVVVHNHVSGVAAPSTQDITFTTGLITAMRPIGIKISDHIIMGRGTEHFSMYRSSKWRALFRY